MSNLLAWTKIWQDDALWVWHKWGGGGEMPDSGCRLSMDQPSQGSTNLPRKHCLASFGFGFGPEQWIFSGKFLESKLAIWQLFLWFTTHPPTKAVRQTMQGEYFCKRPPLKIFHPVIGVRPQGGSQMHCTSEADAKTSFYFNLRRWWMIGRCSVLYFMLQFSTLFCLCVNCISLVTMGTWHGRHMCQECGKKERGNFRERWRNTETNFSPKYIPASECLWVGAKT